MVSSILSRTTKVSIVNTLDHGTKVLRIKMLLCEHSIVPHIQKLPFQELIRIMKNKLIYETYLFQGICYKELILHRVTISVSTKLKACRNTSQHLRCYSLNHISHKISNLTLISISPPSVDLRLIKIDINPN